VSRRQRGWRILPVVALVAITLGACTSPDPSPVSPTAAAPWVCPGVPRDGSELALGGDVTAETSGRWAAEGPGFFCTVKREDSSDGTILVMQGPVGSFASAGATAELQLAAIKREEGAEPIDADATGEGYAFGAGVKPTAAWVCGERVFTVELVSVDVEGRDGVADAENLLVSMLPWACGDEEAPGTDS